MKIQNKTKNVRIQNKQMQIDFEAKNIILFTAREGEIEGRKGKEKKETSEVPAAVTARAHPPEYVTDVCVLYMYIYDYMYVYVYVCVYTNISTSPTTFPLL